MLNSDDTINQLNAATSVVVLIVSIGSFVPGAIGLILNVLIFSQPALRRETCALYFLSSTCFNLFIVFIVIPVRIVSNSFNEDMSNTNLGLCKIEPFAFYVVRATSCWLIAFACVDRYLHSSTNARIRRLSSWNTARIVVGITPIVMAILYSHMILFYGLSYTTDSFGNRVSVCTAQKGIYGTFIALWHMTLYSLCPSFLMLCFGLLTMKNIRQRRQVLPTVVNGNGIGRCTDSQLLRMLAAQVLVIIISTAPFSIYRLYASLTANEVRSSLRVAQENLAFSFFNAITYFAHSSSFYLFTLTGAAFRQELSRIVARYLHQNRNLGGNVRDGRSNRVVQAPQRMTTERNASTRQ